MIIKEPVDRKNNTKKFCFTKTGRVAFSHILMHIFSKTDKKILMPAYIGETDKEGSGVFDPVRENKIPFEFYTVNKKLSADMEDLKAKIITGNFKALLVIHYFGFVQNDIEEISALCKDNKVFLIEDCAHSFHSSYKGRNIGEWGDLAFFSIHKIIPTQDGGYLRINNSNIEIAELNYEDQNIMPVTLDQFIRTDYDKVNKTRILNYAKYLNCFHGIKGIEPLYSELPSGIVPLNFPIVIGSGQREKLYFKLLEKGIITCSLYYRIIEEIDKYLYPISYEISGSILNLPTHQDTNFADIDQIILKLKDSIQEIN